MCVCVCEKEREGGVRLVCYVCVHFVCCACLPACAVCRVSHVHFPPQRECETWKTSVYAIGIVGRCNCAQLSHLREQTSLYGWLQWASHEAQERVDYRRWMRRRCSFRFFICWADKGVTCALEATCNVGVRPGKKKATVAVSLNASCCRENAA